VAGPDLQSKSVRPIAGYAAGTFDLFRGDCLVARRWAPIIHVTWRGTEAPVEGELVLGEKSCADTALVWYGNGLVTREDQT
jgi:hypothetical protein